MDLPKLPDGYTWLMEQDRWSLLFHGEPILEIAKVGRGGWLIRVLIGSPASRTQIAVQSPAHGASWATRWAKARDPMIVSAVNQLHASHTA